MRADLANLAKSLGGIAACGYVLLLACRGQLGFYIHPRYHLFAAILSTIGIAFLVIDIILQLKAEYRLYATISNSAISSSPRVYLS